MSSNKINWINGQEVSNIYFKTTELKLCRSQILYGRNLETCYRSVNVKIWSGLKFYGWTKCERERAYWNTPVWQRRVTVQTVQLSQSRVRWETRLNPMPITCPVRTRIICDKMMDRHHFVKRWYHLLENHFKETYLQCSSSYVVRTIEVPFERNARTWL